ncbi:hypothetical protein REPUB_Repub03eG0102200 [Reevesia pubescens]
MISHWMPHGLNHKGKYWEVPESISVDTSSLPSDSGLLYRFGIHKSGGHLQALNALDSEAPSALMLGICAKAAFPYEKSNDIWRRNERKEDLIVKTDKGSFWPPSYDVRFKEPHTTISGIIGCQFVKRGKEMESWTSFIIVQHVHREKDSVRRL